MSSTTDSLEKVANPDFEQRPGVANLVQILELLQPDTQYKVSEMNYKEFKELVAKSLADFLSGFQSKLTQVNEDKIVAKLHADEQAMSKVADATLLKVQQAVGLRSKS